MRFSHRENGASGVFAEAGLMSHQPPYADAREQAWHGAAIAALADQLARPVHEIQPVYEDILEQMKPQVAIDDFLPIFVAKRVRRLLGN